MTLEINEWKEYVSYNPYTGRFFYIKSNHPKQVVGKECISKTGNGYSRISLNRNSVAAHRLALALHTGEWPVGVIDHINMNRLDNRIENLRDTSRSVNQENRQKAQKNSSTKLLGAYKHLNKFVSQIKVRGTLHYLGIFDTPEEAHEVYLQAKRKLHEGNTL